MDDSRTTILALVGCVTGCIGTAIGIWNLWLSRKGHRVRLVLHGTSKAYLIDNHGQSRPPGLNETARLMEFDVRIENRSYFAISIAEVGLWVGRRTLCPYNHIFKRNHEPLRVESRDQCHVQFTFSIGAKGDHETESAKRILEDARYVYATSVTGEVFRGAKQELRAMKWWLEEIEKQRGARRSAS
jgi:hypothetical protein